MFLGIYCIKFYGKRVLGEKLIRVTLPKKLTRVHIKIYFGHNMSTYTCPIKWFHVRFEAITVFKKVCTGPLVLTYLLFCPNYYISTLVTNINLIPELNCVVNFTHTPELQLSTSSGTTINPSPTAPPQLHQRTTIVPRGGVYELLSDAQ